MSLENDIKHLRGALKSRDVDAALEVLETIDWKAWNEAVSQNPLRRASRALCVLNHPLVHQRDVDLALYILPLLANKGCNILLDTHERGVLLDHPSLYRVYARAHQLHGYTDELGNTPLHWASEQALDPGASVQACLKEGLDPNARNNYGDTPYHEFWREVLQQAYEEALTQGRLDRMVKAMKALLLGGADPYAVNAEGLTPFKMMEEGIQSYTVLRGSGAELRAFNEVLHAQWQAHTLEKFTADDMAANTSLRPGTRSPRL